MPNRREVIKFFKARGFVLVAGTNHDRLVNPDTGRWTTLGRHSEIPRKLFEEMKKQAGLK
ncbi:type II toxin-antitoxin system HicA family toxin [uncultured Adlercreutzia sp.]|uniref:type II toxin-antitoxin system HicA family toxin n=1 Tax=uncultured Adlercreutzia sp. TaxID=875803 RepID=UPI0025CFDE38|nr:type II toxin-antitoxin system HicA family toxin [uncultured Adlercreutzia sp.]